MREDVIIVLNEREPAKQQFASDLEQILAQRKICAMRISPLAELVNILSQRSPKIVVLDYLLESYGTALDLLSTFIENPALAAPKVIIWTDEPSVSTAVRAIKLGAEDYIELPAPNSLDNVIVAIEKSLQKTSPQKNKLSITKEEASKWIKPIANSPAFIKTLGLASSIAKLNPAVVVLVGERGTGRSTIAKYIHQQRTEPGMFAEYDLDLWQKELEELCATKGELRGRGLLSFNSTIMLDHIEFDTAEVIEHLKKNYLPERENEILIVGTSSEEAARAWVRIMSASRLDIPNISARKSDIPGLVESFLSLPNISLSYPKFSKGMLSILANMTWPGNVAQLKAAVIEAATIPTADLEALYSNEKLDPKEYPEKIKKSDQLVLSAILDCRKRWEGRYQRQVSKPKTLEVASALKLSRGNYRIAAAMLGTGTLEIRDILELDKN